MSDYVRYESWIKKNHLTISDNLTNMLAGYATVSYSYENHFTLNVNGRFDASNKFGSRSNEKFFPDWSDSGMWNGKENLLKNVEFVSNLQLRASFGIQGNMLDDQSPNLIIRKAKPRIDDGSASCRICRPAPYRIRCSKARSNILTDAGETGCPGFWKSFLFVVSGPRFVGRRPVQGSEVLRLDPGDP